MVRLRIVTAGAVFSAFLGLAVVGASAQTATTVATGKPLPLLQIVQQKGKAKLRLHHRLSAKFAKRASAKRRSVKRAEAKTHFAHTHLAKAHIDNVPAPQPPAPAATAAMAALPENIWPAAPAADAASPGEMSTLAPPSPASVTTEPDVNTDPDQIVANGQTVQVASPNEVNPIDLGADDRPQAATTATAAAPEHPVAPQPVVHAMVVKSAPPTTAEPAPVGSATWIAHLLAALGGAIAAGAVAWFLISPGPQRTYG